MNDKSTDKCDRSKFTLDRPITYQIKVAGRLGENWSDWIAEMDIQVEADASGLTTTTLTGAVDQAALIGLLRQLYYLGFPLISVNSIRSRRNEDD
jgi:hypothetical protein